MNRAKRRHFNQVKKKRASKIGKINGAEEIYTKNYNHIKGCSCWMCGNPRKHFGEKTRQELKAQDAKEIFD